MAPVTATATGVARQTIDDPNLIALIERLSKFDRHYHGSSASDEVLGDAAAPAPAGSAVDGADVADDGDFAMADATNSNNDSHGDSPAAASKPPPLDVEGLVVELDSVVPKWQFQELVRDRLSFYYDVCIIPIVLNLTAFLFPPDPRAAFLTGQSCSHLSPLFITVHSTHHHSVSYLL